MGSAPPKQRGPERDHSWAAYAACAWALAFAVPTFYWAAGGAVGTETIAADVDELGLSDPWVLAGTGVVKVLGGVVALALVRSWGGAIPRRLLLGAAWSAAALLIVYAIANFVDHGLMEAGVRNIPEALGSDAVRWHLLLWDPWWLLGGVLFAVAAWQYRFAPALAAHRDSLTPAGIRRGQPRARDSPPRHPQRSRDQCVDTGDAGWTSQSPSLLAAKTARSPKQERIEAL